MNHEKWRAYAPADSEAAQQNPKLCPVGGDIVYVTPATDRSGRVKDAPGARRAGFGVVMKVGKVGAKIAYDGAPGTEVATSGYINWENIKCLRLKEEEGTKETETTSWSTPLPSPPESPRSASKPPAAAEPGDAKKSRKPEESEEAWHVWCCAKGLREDPIWARNVRVAASVGDFDGLRACTTAEVRRGVQSYLEALTQRDVEQRRVSVSSGEGAPHPFANVLRWDADARRATISVAWEIDHVVPRRRRVHSAAALAKHGYDLALDLLIGGDNVVNYAITSVDANRKDGNHAHVATKMARWPKEDRALCVELQQELMGGPLRTDLIAFPF